MIDGDLELIAPQFTYIDQIIASCQHPLTQRDAPAESRVTRRQLIDFLQANPLGHQHPDPIRGNIPAYHFWMRLIQPQWDIASQGSQLEIAGGIGLRIGNTPDIELYYGHVGYHVFPAARGRHYAQRAVQLVLPLARRHGIRDLWITCNPENTPSRRTCEHLGGQLVETISVPSNHPLYLIGDRHKCRYLLKI